MEDYNNDKSFIKYKKINIFNKIDNIDKAYWLGIIAAKGEFNKKEMSITIALKNDELYILNILVHLFNKDSRYINVVNIYNRTVINILSLSIYIDICNIFNINIYNSVDIQKNDELIFPKMESNEMKLYFIKGYFDNLCFISDKKVPVCYIPIKSNNIINGMTQFLQIPYKKYNNKIIYSGMNVIDIFGKLYDNVKHNNLYSKLKYKLFVNILDSSNKNNALPDLPKCKVLKTQPGAIIPYKKNLSDVGYDITIINEYKKVNDNTILYDTGLKIFPEFGYYTQIVPRSSLSKSGYIISNSIGIIENTYSGNLYIALTKVEHNAPDLQLPFRCGQLIFQKQIYLDIVEITEMPNISTLRDCGGFGSTNC
jgi:dUTPase